MNKLTKENKGITLVILVLTIIILLIITGTITGSAIKAYKDAQVTEFVLKMQIIQAKVDERSITEDQINALPAVSGDNITILQKAKTNNEISTDQNFKYLSKENVERLFELENIDDINDEFLINFTTREVVSVTGVEYEDNMYYTQYLLPGAQTVRKDFVAKARDCDFSCNVFIKDKKAEVEVYNVQIGNGTLSYQEEGDSFWTTVENSTNSNDTYKFTIEKTGTYNIKIKDNTSNEESVMEGINIALINFPELEEGMILIENENLSEENLFIDYDYYYDKENESWNSEKWLYAEKNSEYYVWLPRFAYRINTEKLEVEYIKDDSNIATTSKHINLNEDIIYYLDQDNSCMVLGIETSPWKVPLKYGSTEKEGSWIKIDDLNQENLNLKYLASREGKLISWDADEDGTEEEWIVLYDDIINGLQVITKEDRKYNGNYFKVGNNDSYFSKHGWPSNLTTSKEKQYYSYNNIVTTLNSACGEYVIDRINVKDVRSVGSNPLNKNDEATTYIQNVGTASGFIKDADQNAKYDTLQLINLNILDMTNFRYYLASRFYETRENNGETIGELAGVNMLYDQGEEHWYDDGIEWWGFDYPGNFVLNHGGSFYESVGNLRPVAILNDDVQFLGEGTESSPYTF